MNRAIVIAMVALLAGVGATAGETGFDTSEVQSLTVRFADLDLRKPAGVAVLHARLRTAASDVCTGSQSGLLGAVAGRQCRTSALARAVSQLPAAVRTHHADWIAAGSKWHPRSGMLPARKLAARR